MSRQAATVALILLWALCVAVGLWRFATLAPTDFGMTRGLNKLEALLSWWAVAAGLAVAAWAAGRGAGSRVLIWASRLPMLWLGAIIALIAAVLIWSRVQHWRHPPQTDPVDRPVTMPAEPPGGQKP